MLVLTRSRVTNIIPINLFSRNTEGKYMEYEHWRHIFACALTRSMVELNSNFLQRRFLKGGRGGDSLTPNRRNRP